MTHQPNFTGVRGQQPGDHTDRGSFPGAVRAEEAEDLSLMDVKTNLVDRMDGLKTFVQIFHSYCIIIHCLSPDAGLELYFHYFILAKKIWLKPR
jgi:hypothetical protein